MLLKLKLKIL